MSKTSTIDPSDLHDISQLTPEPETRITGLLYRSIRKVTAFVGETLDYIFVQRTPLRSETPLSHKREALLAALNGVLGDYLVDTRNPLAISMCMRHEGWPLALEPQALTASLPKPAAKLLVLVHGLCMNDLQWSRKALPAQGRDDLYTRLARELGYVPVYLHYNSGRHISTNGREFTLLMETLIKHWPVPVEELVIIANSMGGLVARSACHYGAMAGHRWLRHLGKLFFLGTPHHGAPFERGGNWIDTMLSANRFTAPLARLGKIRSAGITDLRYGNLLDEDWEGLDRFERGGDRRKSVPLPSGVKCYALAVTTGKHEGDLGDRLLGDGLVPVNSALGRHREPALSLPFPASRQWVGYGMHHLKMISHPAVVDQVRRWLSPQAVHVS